MTPEIKQRIEQVRRGEVPEGYVRTKTCTIPDGWHCYPIYECLSIRNHERKPISKEKRKTIPGPYPYYGPTQAQGYISTYKSEGPAVLIGEDGDHFLKYKDRKMTMYVDGKYTVNNHAHILIGTDLCETKWFYYAYQHKSLVDAITRQGAGRYKLTKEALTKLILQCPPLNEQKRIINILTTQDKVIELKAKLLAEKQQQKKWLMQQLLTGKKRLPGFNGKWERVKLYEILIPGNKEPIPNTVDYQKITIKLNFNGIEYTKTNREMADTRPFYVRKENEIIIGKQNYFNGSIALVTKEFDGCICSNAIMSFSVNGANLYYVLKYLSQNDFLKRHQMLAHGTGQKELSEKDFLGFEIALPTSEEQNAIVEVLAATDRELELLQQNIEQEKQKKKALMQLLLTGIVRVKV